MADVSGVDNLGSSSNGSTSLAGIKSAVDNLNTAKAEASLTVNGKALSTNPVLGLASADFANQGSVHTVLHGNASGNPAFSAVVEADITLADNTTNNASASAHGFLPKLPNTGSAFLRDDGTFASVANPTGSILMFGGSSAPTGYLICDGSAVSRSTYAALFTALSTTYGTGDGSTTFNLPDLRGRAPVGVGTGTGGGASGTGTPTGGSGLTAVSLGTWKGEETHTLTGPESGIASHTHTVNASSGGGGVTSVLQATGMTVTTSASPSAYTTPATGPTNAASAHNTIQPVMGVNFIIKT